MDFKCNLRKRKITTVKLPTQGEGSSVAREKATWIKKERKDTKVMTLKILEYRGYDFLKHIHIKGIFFSLIFFF